MTNSLNQLSETTAIIFGACHQAIENRILISRETSTDKEFHFQNWFQSILEEQQIIFDEPKRNTYPDFQLTNQPLGFEIKGLSYGRYGSRKNYDSNSQFPHGCYQNREIIYVFGRYPAKPESNTYPVLDLIMCHGSFLNSDDDYIHDNKNVKGMGSYGDILLRDRKMYVPPTPFSLLNGVEKQVTLILPNTWPAPSTLTPVGNLTRVEGTQKMTGYSFDLTTNDLIATWGQNPTGGTKHKFVAYRYSNNAESPVDLKEK